MALINGRATGNRTFVPTPQPNAPASNALAPAVEQLNQDEAAKLHDQYAGADSLAKYRAERSNETNALIAKAMGQTDGINSLENAALRQNALSSINSQTQSALRLLKGQQAASGIRGGVAAAQQGQQWGQAVGALQGAERNLVADNIKYKQDALKTAANIVGGQEDAERNMAADKLSTILAIRGQNTALQGAKMQADAARAGGGGGGKK